MRLWTELRRRNVFRMAALYAVAAWLVMQVAEVVVGLANLPEWLGPVILSVLAIGFPIALVVSWFFDITPEGIVRDVDIPEGQPTFAAGGRRTDFVIIAILAAAVILLLVWDPPASGDEALTVLPFESMTGPDGASFSEGVSIELLNLLAQLHQFKVKNPPAADILARLSDVPTLAREMDVRWVLKGSVRHSGRRVRIAVQLIDTGDNAAIAWSNVFDRELSAENLFAIQAEIARSITSEMRQSLDEPAEQRLAGPPTKNTEAYASYLLGRQRLSDRRVDWLDEAVDQFANAIDLDPNFGNAYSGLADACALYGTYGPGQDHARCPDDETNLVALARKAVRLAPNSGEAWISLGGAVWKVGALSVQQVNDDVNKIRGLVHSDEHKELVKEAEAAFERGISLNPGYAQGYLWYADFLFQKSIWNETWFEAWKDDVWWTVIKRGLEADPLSLQLHYLTYYPDFAKTREESLAHARRILEIAPDSPRGYERLGIELWRNYGRADEMVRLVSNAAELDPKRARYPYITAFAYMALGDYEMALAYFRLAIDLGATAPQADHAEALALMYAGRTDQAIELLKSLQGNKETYPHVPLNLLAGNDIHSGQPEKALSRYRQYEPRCFDDPDWENLDWSCPFLGFMRVLQEVGDEERFQRILVAWAESDKKHPEWRGRAEELEYYPWLLLWVRLDALAGRHEQALSVFEDLVAKGFRGSDDPRLYWRFFAYHDISVDSIRGHPRFQAAVAVIEADMAKQLENVRAMERRGEIPTLEELIARIASE